MKSIIVFLNLVLATLWVSAEPEPSHSISDEMPLNPAVRTGVLENGFTYYIQENKKPEQRVEMRLAVNAGSVLEDEDQRGLAHFCEHMAFNGTEHFQKNELVSYLQSIGVKFGPDINAYTSFDETVYKLTIPTDKVDLVEKGFLVMHDWATGCNFDAQQIDDERGVIVEEWRQGRGANQRMLDQYLPVLLKDSRYAERLPIGLLDVVESCEHDTLRRFYQEWYRPDLMALIVVGDIDVDETEAKIIEQFADLEEPKNVRDREVFEVPDHAETLVSIVSDPEASQSLIQFNQKFEKSKDHTVAGFLDDLRFGLYTAMLNMRMAELSQQAEPPFIYSGFYYGHAWTRDVEAYVGQALVVSGGVKKGLTAMLEENKRAAESGFTPNELIRAKANVKSGFERQYAEREKTESKRFASQYVNHYLEASPVPGIEYTYEVVQEYLDDITLDEVNGLAENLRETKNRVFVITGPEQIEDEISEEEVLALVEKVDALKLEAYAEETIASELVSDLPQPGKVVSTEIIDSIDTKHLVLSNGVNVYLKQTDFKNDEILFEAFSKGGASLTALDDKYSVAHSGAVLSTSGWGEFSAMDLNKFLAGKQVSVSPAITEFGEMINGACRPQDMEDFFQLLHLVFTAPRKDDAAFSSIITRMSGYVQHMLMNPNTYFQDKYMEFMSQGHPRGRRIPRPEDLQHVDQDRVWEIYKERFADADDFIFVFVGSFDETKLVTMLERYIACLPSIEGEEEWVDFGIRPPAGPKELNVYKGQDEKSMTILNFSKEIEFDRKRELMLSALAKYLDIRFTEVLREELGGVYSIGVSGRLTGMPYPRASLQVNLPSAPDNVDKLVGEIVKIMKDVSENGVEEEYVGKIQEIFRRDNEVKSKKNRPWMRGILNCARWEKDFEVLVDYDVVDTISSEGIQAVFNECFDADVYLKSTLYPESMKPE